MTIVDIQNIESCTFNGISNFSFLDMASARGHFVDWAKSKTEQIVWCIEPDKYMTSSYENDPKLELIVADYRDVTVPSSFDFIYSCHTLEHFRDPIQYLDFVFKHLKEEGFFYVNVPNLLGILDSVAVDDFFYDKHRVYFDPETLKNLLLWQGFVVIKEWVDSACIRLLVQKSQVPATPRIDTVFHRNSELISKYSATLEDSRKALPRAVSLLSELLSDDATKIILGCGRMLDALITYGLLDLSRFNYLVDNYLGLATTKLYARDLFRLETLPAILGEIQFVVVSRTSNHEIGKMISTRYPAAQIIYVGSILESVN